jgi:hypothetical protein
MPATFDRPAPSSRAPSRLRLVTAALGAWLESQGATPPQREAMLRALAPDLPAWLERPRAEAADGFLDAFALFVDGRPELAPWQAQDTRAALAAALARSVLMQATAEVEAEAARAGHLDAFHALLPWLGRELPADAAMRLAAERGVGAVALDRALVRLRRRWRQRIDAGLALCSDEGARRDELRARLHATLVHGEIQP